MFCKYCGKELPDKSVFCSDCGKQLVENSGTTSIIPSYLPPKTKTLNIKPDSSKSRLIAALLAFFFGDLGAHRFYVGKFFTGFIQLILGLSSLVSLVLFLLDEVEIAVVMVFVGVIWGFWTLVDFLMILCGTFTDGKGLKITDWDM